MYVHLRWEGQSHNLHRTLHVLNGFITSQKMHRFRIMRWEGSRWIGLPARFSKENFFGGGGVFVFDCLLVSYT